MLDRETLPDAIRVRPPRFAHHLETFPSTRPDAVAERIAGATIVITNKVPVRREAIEGAKDLKLVAVAATGTDVVDVAACAARGIAVCNIRNYAVHTVPEHTFALMLALRRSILAYHDSVRRGRWGQSGQFCYFDYPINDLSGSTLGIIGDGVLGRAVGKVAEAFGMQVLFAAYKGVEGMGPLYTPFAEVLRRSDVLTLHSPLMPSTRDMIAAPEFALMERRPLLINTARGGLVNEADSRGGAGGGPDRRGGLRRGDGRAAAARPSVLPADGPARLHPHAACRLGQPRGHPGPGRPADRQHRGVLGRQRR